MGDVGRCTATVCLGDGARWPQRRGSLSDQTLLLMEDWLREGGEMLKEEAEKML